MITKSKCRIQNCEYTAYEYANVATLESDDEQVLRTREIVTYCWLHLPENATIILEYQEKPENSKDRNVFYSRYRTYREAAGTKTKLSDKDRVYFQNFLKSAIESGCEQFSGVDNRRDRISIPPSIEILPTNFKKPIQFRNVNFLGDFKITNLNGPSIQFHQCSASGNLSVKHCHLDSLHINVEPKSASITVTVDDINPNTEERTNVSVTLQKSAKVSIQDIPNCRIFSVNAGSNTNPLIAPEAKLTKITTQTLEASGVWNKLDFDDVTIGRAKNIGPNQITSISPIPTTLAMKNVTNHGELILLAGSTPPVIDIQGSQKVSINLAHSTAVEVESITIKNCEVGDLTIQNCKINKQLNLAGTTFNGLLDITEEAIGNGPIFPEVSHFNSPLGSDAERCYRRIHNHLIDQGDHIQAGTFFELELDCINHKESLRKGGGFATFWHRHLSWSALYKFFSNYGMSTGKPLAWIATAFLISWVTQCIWFSDCYNPVSISCEINFHAGNEALENNIKTLIIPFSIWRKDELLGTNYIKVILPLKIWLTLFTIFTFSMLYLFFLALRWRFRQR